MNIYEKLIEMRKDFHSKSLKKSGKNKFVGFEYFELKDFIPTAVELLHKHKLSTVFNITDEVATLTLINNEKTDEIIVFNTPVADATSKGQLPIQSLGSQHTYLRRYLYLNLLDIVESDGVDGLSNDDEEPTSQTKTKATSKEVSTATDKQLELVKQLYTVDEINTMLSRLDKDLYSLTVKEASDMIKARSKK